MSRCSELWVYYNTRSVALKLLVIENLKSEENILHDNYIAQFMKHKPTFTQILNKYSSFYATRKMIAIFTTLHKTVLWALRMQSMSPNLMC
jgi:hypothetical protein